MSRVRERPVLGVDVGGVIATRTGSADTSLLGDSPMDTPAVPGVVEALRELVAELDGCVHIVTKCGPKVERATRDWLHHIGFWDRTGVDSAHLHVVRRRPDKAPVCQRLHVTHFVDDRLDVLSHLTTVRRRYWFTGGSSENVGGAVPPWAIHVQTWTAVRDAVLADVVS